MTPDRLSKILAAGPTAVTDADLHILIQGYRLLLSLRDKAKSENTNPWELKRALALLGSDEPERWSLDELFEDNGK